MGVNYTAGNGSCLEGELIESGDVCTASCLPGYTATSNLSCAGAVLTPATFECLPDPCPAPVFPNSNGTSCLEGPFVPSGGVAIGSSRWGGELPEGPLVKGRLPRSKISTPRRLHLILRRPRPKIWPPDRRPCTGFELRSAVTDL